MASLTVLVLTYESRGVVGACLEAVRGQTQPAACVRVLDNGSSDGTVDWVEEAWPGVEVRRFGENLGYAAAYNRGLAEVTTERVVLLNPDCVLEPEYLERCQAALDADAGLAAVQGKLLKLDGETLDSTGIAISRSRRNVDRGEGERDRGQWDGAGEVFGVSGAAGVWRREALEDVDLGEGPLDGSYWMYREDLDVCWRARLLGWRFGYVPEARARHARGFGRRDRARVPRALRHASLRNRYLTLLKNEDLRALAPDLARLLPFELAQLGYVAVREPALLWAYVDVLRRVPRVWAERQRLRARRRVAPGALRSWFGRREGQ